MYTQNDREDVLVRTFQLHENKQLKIRRLQGFKLPAHIQPLGKLTGMNGTGPDAHAYVIRLTGSHGWRLSNLFFALKLRQAIRHSSFPPDRKGRRDCKYHYPPGIVAGWAGRADTRSQQRKRRLENHCGLI